MVKSKSMDVVKAVSEDLTEVKESLGSMQQYTAPIAMAGGVVKSTLKEIDEITDEMAESAISGVSKGATSLWTMASGYASQMFTEEDLAATAVMVGTNHEPIILDRLQAQLHALSSDQDTYESDPHPGDCLAEEWTAWLAELELEKRQGEISELMINNNNIRSDQRSLPGSDLVKYNWIFYLQEILQ